MLDNANTLLSVLSYVIIITAGVAGIAAFFRSRYIKSTLEELRGDRDDLLKRTERLEKERDDLREGNARRDTLIEQLQSQNDTLKEALSGKAQLNHLQEQLDAHDARVDARHATLTAQMQEVIKNNKALMEVDQELIDSNSYVTAALIDFLKKEEAKDERARRAKRLAARRTSSAANPESQN